MTLKLHWFLPTHGDGRAVADRGHVSPERAVTARGADIDYLAQIAQAAEHMGFEGMLTPTGTWCQDAWLSTAALIARTQRIKFLVALRPGLLSPTLAAQMAATYQGISRGRLLLNVVTGGESAEQRRFGDQLDHDERYARTDEFLSVLRSVMSGEPTNFTGAHYDIADARVFAAPDPAPEIYFGGSSPAALPVAARHVDVYLTWGEPPAAVAEKIARVKQIAAGLGRELRFGVRLHTISRDSSEQAWAVAQQIQDGFDPADVAASQAAFARSESEGQRRMAALNQGRLTGDARGLEIHPGLWAGVGLVRGGAGTALVGSHSEVADLLAEYHAVGVTEFVLSGYPHLEEAYWFGEGVRPELARRGLLAGQRNSTEQGVAVAAL